MHTKVYGMSEINQEELQTKSITWTDFFFNLVKLTTPSIWTLIVISIAVLIFMERDYHHIKILLDSGYEQKVDDNEIIWIHVRK